MNTPYEERKVLRVANSAVAATTEVLSSVIDMSADGGWDSVEFVAALGDVTINSVLTLTLKENTASSTSSPTPTAITGGATAAYTATATDADNKILRASATRNSITKQYVFASLTRTAANAVVDGIFAILSRGKKLPYTQDSSVLAAISAAA